MKFSDAILGRSFGTTVEEKRKAFRGSFAQPVLHRRQARPRRRQPRADDFEPPTYKLNLEGGDRFGRFGRLAG